MGQLNLSILPLFERANQIAAGSDPHSLLEQTLSLLVETCAARAGALYLLDESAQALVCKAGDSRPFGAHVALARSLAGKALRQRRLFHKEDISAGKFHALLSLPLLSGDKAVGVVHLFDFTQPAFDLAQLLADRLAGDIDRSIQLEASRQHTLRLEALIAILGQIGTSLDRDQILRVIIDSARDFLQAEACSLFLVDEATGDLELVIASNVDERIRVEQVRIPAGKGIIGEVVASGETILVADTSSDERHYGGVDLQSGFVTRSILALPLRSRKVDLGQERGVTPERILGGLEALNKIQGTFSQDDASLLRILANQAATVLEIAGLYTDSNELFLDVVRSLTAAIDAKDPYTEGHSRRVSEFSVEIARSLGLPPEQIYPIRIGSLLHDVGKIGIPDAILAKAGDLTEAEFDLIKQHPAIGARIMSQVRMLHAELPMLAEHQERLDGSGYPEGLKEGQISLTSRIVAVADVFDALTSDRPYRKASPAEEALEYLRSHVDTHFDRTCVEALARAYHRHAIHTAGMQNKE
jgi:HD-GYP domain-containing protein (c-di-GMP phosphodiesterase class II)